MPHQGSRTDGKAVLHGRACVRVAQTRHLPVVAPPLRRGAATMLSRILICSPWLKYEVGCMQHQGHNRQHRNGSRAGFCLATCMCLFCLFLSLPCPVGAASAPAQPPTVQLFGTVELRRPLASLPAWLQLLARNLQEPVFQPDRAFNNKTTWAQLRDGAAGKKGLALLRHVNTFWNAWPYREDIHNWGQQDYWEIPAEFLKKSGDCEDYAIIKYFTLRELGIPPQHMRIVVVRDTLRRLAHAVLVVYLDKDAYVLDNLSRAVLSHTRLRHYAPQYSVNESGRWAHLKGRKLP